MKIKPRSTKKPGNLPKNTLPPSIQELLQGLNILLVDNIAIIRNILKRQLIVLEADGQIDVAEDGLQAWILLQERSYSLIWGSLDLS